MKFIEIENQYYILASEIADQKATVIKEGESFALFELHGNIYPVPAASHGIFHNGTRHLSHLELQVNGQKPLLLSSVPREDNQMIVVDLTNPDLEMGNGGDNVVLRGSIHISRSKFLWMGTYHERIKVINFGLDPVTFEMSLKFDADFADIFEVRGMHRKRRGESFSPEDRNGEIVFGYKGLDDVVRETRIGFSPAPDQLQSKTASYRIKLDLKDERIVELTARFSEGPAQSAEAEKFDIAKNAMNAHMEKVRNYCAAMYTSNDQFNEWITRSRNDLITMTTRTKYGLYPYAGIPWYSTAFGRDGIITAFECLWIEPELARGVLNYLAQTQARDFNDFQDAEPGKIFHETRGGEMAALGETPFRLYYGTIDATPLFVMLAGAYLERTNDLATIREIWTNIESALSWIDDYGDADNDGFVEYKTKSSKGLTNQGWKDSYDSVFHDDGTLASEPIALCEVQGYVYDAKMSAAKIASALGYEDRAARLADEADSLKEKFNRQFWSETKQVYALALDGQKKQCNVISSNAGHCLFSGIATVERAHLTAKNLMNENSFSGWGIRTIAMSEARYNPMSYHNGSVWPHDNAMIAFGFSRYHLMDEAAKVLKGAFDTAVQYADYRLPELFCGFDRVKGQAPTSYPVACSPQAWSVGSIFLLIQSCLGLRIVAAENKIYLHYPMLPAFLKELTISNLKINGKSVVLQVRRTRHGVEAHSLSPDANVGIEVHNRLVAAE